METNIRPKQAKSHWGEIFTVKVVQKTKVSIPLKITIKLHLQVQISCIVSNKEQKLMKIWLHEAS